MHSLLLTLLAGVAATAVMTIALYGFSAVAGTRMGLFSSLSRILTVNRSSAQIWGIALHIVTGAVAAFLYVGIWSIFGFEGVPVLAGLGAFVGVAHGLVASQVLVAIEGTEAQESARLSLALPYFAAHVVYGVTLGICTSLFQLQWDFVTPIL